MESRHMSLKATANAYAVISAFTVSPYTFYKTTTTSTTSSIMGSNREKRKNAATEAEPCRLAPLSGVTPSYVKVWWDAAICFKMATKPLQMSPKSSGCRARVEALHHALSTPVSAWDKQGRYYLVVVDLSRKHVAIAARAQ